MSEAKRGPGRPANFPGQEIKPFMHKIPVETTEMVNRLAERRDEPVAVTLDRMIRRAYSEANRSRSKATAS